MAHNARAEFEERLGVKHKKSISQHLDSITTTEQQLIRDEIPSKFISSTDNHGQDYLKSYSLNKPSKDHSTNNFNNVSISHQIASDRSHLTGNFNQTDASLIFEDNQNQSKVISNLPNVPLITPHVHKKNYSTSERIEILSKPKT